MATHSSSVTISESVCSKKQKSNIAPSIFVQHQDQSEYESLRDTLKVCDLMVNITAHITSLIAQYGIGDVVLCDCKENEIFISPSMKDEFKQYECVDCDDGICSSITCENCIEKGNDWIWPRRKAEKSYPIILCSACMII